MRVTASLSKLCSCLVLIACASLTQAMEVNINFLLGSKALDSDEWGNAALGVDAASQAVFGVETTFGATSWPVAIALDYIGSGHHDEVLVTSPVPAQVDVTQGTLEFDFGVRKIWKSGKARPYVGGGFGIIGARQEVPAGIGLLTVEDSDGSLGLWFNGGAFWRLGKKFNIGVDLRLSTAEVQLFGRDVQAGGVMLGLLLGWGWGGGAG